MIEKSNGRWKSLSHFDIFYQLILPSTFLILCMVLERATFALCQLEWLLTTQRSVIFGFHVPRFWLYGGTQWMYSFNIHVHDDKKILLYFSLSWIETDCICRKTIMLASYLTKIVYFMNAMVEVLTLGCDQNGRIMLKVYTCVCRFKWKI